MTRHCFGCSMAEVYWARYSEKCMVLLREKYGDCWYCQLGIGSGRMSLRSVPEPPDWKKTLCKSHLSSVTMPHEDGDAVVCEICKEDYKYKPWNRVMGRQDKRCFCQKCVSKFPAFHLDDDRLDEGEPGEQDHLTNFEKTYGGGDTPKKQ